MLINTSHSGMNLSAFGGAAANAEASIPGVSGNGTGESPGGPSPPSVGGSPASRPTVLQGDTSADVPVIVANDFALRQQAAARVTSAAVLLGMSNKIGSDGLVYNGVGVFDAMVDPAAAEGLSLPFPFPPIPQTGTSATDGLYDSSGAFIGLGLGTASSSTAVGSHFLAIA